MASHLPDLFGRAESCQPLAARIYFPAHVECWKHTCQHTCQRKNSTWNVPRVSPNRLVVPQGDCRSLQQARNTTEMEESTENNKPTITKKGPNSHVLRKETGKSTMSRVAWLLFQSLFIMSTPNPATPAPTSASASDAAADADAAAAASTTNDLTYAYQQFVQAIHVHDTNSTSTSTSPSPSPSPSTSSRDAVHAALQHIIDVCGLNHEQVHSQVNVRM